MPMRDVSEMEYGDSSNHYCNSALRMAKQYQDITTGKYYTCFPIRRDNLRKYHFDIIDRRWYHFDLIDGTIQTIDMDENSLDINENAVHMRKAQSIFYERAEVTHFISKVTYIENGAIQKSFEDCRKSYERHRIPYVEDYLFHGTDVSKVDSIFTHNFDIENKPAGERTKVISMFKIFTRFPLTLLNNNHKGKLI